MLSRFFGKSSPTTDVPAKTEVPVSRGLEVTEDDPETAWGLWDEALATQSARPKAPNPGETAGAIPPVEIPTAPTRVAPVRDAGFTGFTAQSGPDVADDEPPTQAMGLDELTPEQRKNVAMTTLEQHHQRIANTIRTLWGYPECSTYINKLIMSGGDGMGNARVGFHQVAVEAMLELAELHDAEFGAPPSGAMTLG